MHNSGTSILAEVLHRHGLFMGANMAHFENRFFSIYVNDLQIMGGGSGWAQLPILTIDEVLAFRNTAGEVILAQWLADFKTWGYDGQSPWGVKDPRMCVLLPLYLDLFPGARVLHIIRDPDDVAASLAHRPKRGTGLLRDVDHWKQLAEAHVERVRDSVAGSGVEYLEIGYEEFCLEPQRVVERIFDFVELPFGSDVGNFLDKNVSSSSVGTANRSGLQWKFASVSKRWRHRRGGYRH